MKNLQHSKVSPNLGVICQVALMNDSTRAIELVDKLEAFFKENALPTSNENAVRTIRHLCSRISTFDGYVAEKCGDIEGLANIFYSARKHKQHNGNADKIYERIVDNLIQIRRRLKNV